MCTHTLYFFLIIFYKLIKCDLGNNFWLTRERASKKEKKKRERERMPKSNFKLFFFEITSLQYLKKKQIK